MSIKKLGNGQYLVDVRPAGSNGKRYRKKFDRKTEASNYEKFVLTNYHDKKWCDRPDDKRDVIELIALWYKLHGQTLKNGEREKRNLIRIYKQMGKPKAYQVTRNFFVKFRAERMEVGIQPSTLNRDHNTLSSLFTALINAGEYHHVHPLKGIKKLKVPPTEMGFLTKKQIDLLLGTLPNDIALIARICLSTGSRWGEANNIRQEHVCNGRITFINTKNNKNRTVPIGDKLYRDLKNLNSGKLFSDSYGQFCIILKELNFDLPKGQASHVLRHTFASHFMMNGGNILTLQKILGHGDIKQTLTYAHFSPDYLMDAIKFNPLGE